MGFLALFNPAWNSKKPEKRMKAVASVTIHTTKGIQKLLQIAENTPYEDTRQEAWKRLLLEAADAAYKDIRITALGKINGESILEKVVLHDGDSMVRYHAMQKISHAELLEKIALQDTAPDNRKWAIRKLTQQDVLWKIITEDKNSSVRLAALDTLNDKTLLRKLAENHAAEWQLRAGAWSRLGEKDQSLYLYVLYDENTWGKDAEKHERQIMALQEIKSQELLCSLVKETSCDAIRRCAVKRLRDPVLLKALLASLASETMRSLVIDVLWERLFSSSEERLLPLLLENSTRDNLIYNLFRMVIDETRQEWLLYCTSETVKRLMLPERSSDGTKITLNYDQGGNLAGVLQGLYNANTELRLCIEAFVGTELVKADNEYHWVECHNSDDSYGFSGRDALHFSLNALPNPNNTLTAFAEKLQQGHQAQDLSKNLLSQKSRKREEEIRAYLLAGKRAQCEKHEWVSLDCCLKKCASCGALQYDHEYKGFNFSDNGFVSSAEFLCKKCGHSAKSHEGFTEEQDYDTREYGLVKGADSQGKQR